MKLLIILAIFASTVSAYNTYSGTCYYNNDKVFETGYSPRAMTNAERNEMLTYGNQWAQYGIQMGHYAKGTEAMPVPPVLPCFCINCQ